MAAALTQPTRDFDSERLRRRRDRHARLATDRALAEVAFALRAHDRQERGPGRPRVAPSSPQGPERDSRLGSGASRRS
jgi:hypothetical protein